MPTLELLDKHGFQLHKNYIIISDNTQRKTISGVIEIKGTCRTAPITKQEKI